VEDPARGALDVARPPTLVRVPWIKMIVNPLCWHAACTLRAPCQVSRSRGLTIILIHGILCRVGGRGGGGGRGAPQRAGSRIERRSPPSHPGIVARRDTTPPRGVADHVVRCYTLQGGREGRWRRTARDLGASAQPPRPPPLDCSTKCVDPQPLSWGCGSTLDVLRRCARSATRVKRCNTEQ
jgi:hypothetical protein